MKNLDFDQMESIQGGVSKEEYCGTVKMILENGAETPSAEVCEIIYNICGAM